MSENTEIEQDDVEAAAREAFEKFTVDAPEKEVEQPEVEDATDAEVVEEVETEAVEVETEEKQSEEKPEVEKEKPLKAPMGWKPDAKEHFDKLPEEVRMAVHAREVEIDRKLKETANERAFAQDMFKVLTPYDADIRASGQHPAQVLKTYLDIENTLNRGDQASKARVIANVIKNRNIDLEVLQDAIIEARGGKVEPRQDSTAAYPPEIQERLKEIDRLKAAEDGRQRSALSLNKLFRASFKAAASRKGNGLKSCVPTCKSCSKTDKRTTSKTHTTRLHGCHLITGRSCFHVKQHPRARP